MCILYLTLKRLSKSNSIKYLKNPIFRIFLVILNLAVLLIWVQFFNLGSVAELMLEKPDRRTDFSCLHCIKCTNVTFKSKFKIRSGCKSCSVILLKKLFKIFIFIFLRLLNMLTHLALNILILNVKEVKNVVVLSKITSDSVVMIIVTIFQIMKIFLKSFILVNSIFI